MWHSLIKERKSQIFIGVLIIFAIIIGLGAALLFHSRSARDISRLQSEAARAYSLARSGLDIGQRLASGVDFDRTYNIGGGTLRIQLAVGTGTLTSTGTVGKSTRVLAKNFSLPLIGGLPKTGQELCYAASGTVIPCSGSGNDAYYADPAGPDVGQTKGNKTWLGWNATDGTGRFTNNGDGTITDNATGLMWVANPTAAGVGVTYKWYDSSLLTYPAIAACEGLDYAGHTDWRLPNIKELQSIVDYGTYNPAIDPNFFTSCQSNYYWSSTTDVSGTGNALAASFAGACSVWPRTKTDAAYVRPVRGGTGENTTGLPKTGQEISYATNDDADYADPASEDIGQTRGEGTWAGWNADGGRFTNNGDGTITDNATGLEWVQSGYANTDTTPATTYTPDGSWRRYTWANALLYCERLDFAGHTDWRLPNVKELQSINDYGAYNPSIDTVFFTNTKSNYYWSSSTDVSNLYNGTWAWVVSFSNGYVCTGNKTFPTYIRPVRGGQ